MSWGRFGLNPSELEHVRYIEYSYWNELSGGSRLPLDAASRIWNGGTVLGQNTKSFLKTAQALKEGAKFPELILVGSEPNSDLVVLEGHVRLTAYFLAPDLISQELSVIVGLSTEMRGWM